MKLDLKVAIIGAGASGLVSTKEMLEQGLKPTVFERNDTIGGVWRTRDGNIWSNMYTNISKFSVSFSSLKWARSDAMFPSAIDVQDYLQKFCHRYEIEQYIRFRTEVQSVKRLDDGKLSIKWMSLETREVFEDQFDYLVLSVGLFSNPKIPQYETSKLFKGKILHSIEYNSLKHSENLNNKRVIVVGHSFSATEISADLVNQGANVVNIFRRPYKVFTKNVTVNDQIKPIDFWMNNRQSAYRIKDFEGNEYDYFREKK